MRSALETLKPRVRRCGQEVEGLSSENTPMEQVAIMMIMIIVFILLMMTMTVKLILTTTMMMMMMMMMIVDDELQYELLTGQAEKCRQEWTAVNAAYQVNNIIMTTMMMMLV